MADNVNPIPEAYRSATLSKAAVSLIALLLVALALGSALLYAPKKSRG